MRRALALCSFLTALVFAPLAALLARLPECAALNAPFWTAAALALTALSFGALAVQLRRSRRRLSPVSIKESCDHLPSALCFAWENGLPCLKNLKMDELSHLLTGEALLNANAFWQIARAHEPIVTLARRPDVELRAGADADVRAKPSTRSPARTSPQEARLQRELEKDNLRLETMNRRLQQYGQAVQEATRRKGDPARQDPRSRRDRPRASANPAVPVRQRRATRRASAPRGGRTSACCWANMRMNSQRAGTFDQLSRAARAIGVTIARTGAFPAEGTEGARLVEIAAHECLTNLVRHAGGSRLEIAGERKAHPAGHVRLSATTARRPPGRSSRGSGLSSLRAQVEAAGGAMTAAHAPRFLLTLIFAEGKAGSCRMKYKVMIVEDQAMPRQLLRAAHSGLRAF